MFVNIHDHFCKVLKFQDLSVFLILREINLEESRSSKIAFFAILFIGSFQTLKSAKIDKKIKIQSL